MTLRLAQVKTVPAVFDLASNHRQLMEVLEAVGDCQPDVVVTPEGFLEGYVVTEESITAENLRDYAIYPETSPYVQSVAGWAADHHCWVILGCARAADEGVYNSAVIIDRAGRLVGIYDKVHCRGCDQKYVAGRRLPIFDSDFGPFGVMICADRRWPETVRTLALRGARVIFNPTYGDHDDMNVQLMRTRSFESEVFIAFTHPAQSLVTGPDGSILSNETGPQTCFSVTELDLSQVDRLRSGDESYLKDRRPEAYQLG